VPTRQDLLDQFGIDSFQNVDLRRVSFQGVALQNENFSGSTFYDCDFSSCNLNGASFDDCDMLRCNFDHCTWVGTSFTNVDWPRSTANDCDFRGAEHPYGTSFIGIAVWGSQFDQQLYDDPNYLGFAGAEMGGAVFTWNYGL